MKKIVGLIVLILGLLHMTGAMASYPNEDLEPLIYSSAVTSRQELLDRLVNLGDLFENTYWTVDGNPQSAYGYSNYYYGWQCNGFAKYIFDNLFRKGNIGAYAYVEGNSNASYYYIPSPNGAVELIKVSYVNSDDGASVRDTLLGVIDLGDLIQVRRRYPNSQGQYYGHTMIVIGADDDGLTLFD